MAWLKFREPNCSLSGVTYVAALSGWNLQRSGHVILAVITAEAVSPQ